MTKQTRYRMGALAMAVALTGAMTACGDDDAAASGGQDTAQDSAQDAAGSPGSGTSDSDTGDVRDNGRAFDSVDAAVVTALTAATQADTVEWEGSTVVITFGEGSVDDPTAWIMCGPATAIIANDESVRLVFPDGQLDCADRPGY